MEDSDDGERLVLAAVEDEVAAARVHADPSAHARERVVLTDHGQGLFSLYSHLSGLAVAEGEQVERGQDIGYSGQTGMAGGDHLHFSLLVSGEFVNPIEWLDDHWIDDNINNKLSLF